MRGLRQPKTNILLIDEAIQVEMSIVAEDAFSMKFQIIFKLLLSSIHVIKQLQFFR